MQATDPRRILVVEDNDINYELVRFILGKMGLSVVRATRGDEVPRIVAAEHPNLIYMDIQLPGMDGLEVTRCLKADRATSHIPVIALTALAMVGDEERAREAGCDGYLTKPISPRQLWDVTARLLDRPEVGGAT